MSVGHFVWVEGLMRPAPEKWPVDAPAGVKAGKRVLASHALNAKSFELPIDTLAELYPLEKA